MSIHHPSIAEIVRQDRRYPYEAYEFVVAAVPFTLRSLGRVPPEEGQVEEGTHHVSGRELALGIRDFALREFGFMARTVFRLWGIHRTADFGEIVFNLIEANVLSKKPEDTRNDFHDVYDLDTALIRDFRFEPEED